jgi:N-acetylneuraminic acid mutarotase
MAKQISLHMGCGGKKKCGLIDIVSTVSYNFDIIVHFLQPREAARLQQASKIFVLSVEAVEEQIVMFLKKQLPWMFLPIRQTNLSFTHQLHELLSNKSKKILLMGGVNESIGVTNRVQIMVINDDGSNISWKTCVPMIKKRLGHLAIYHQGKILVASSDAVAKGTCEQYDVLLQKSETKQPLPIPNLCNFAMVELDSKTFIIGGEYQDADQCIISNRVFCLDNTIHTDTWVEQAVTATARSGAVAVTYQGKIWLAGGYDGNNRLSNIEIYDPLESSWQPAGNFINSQCYSSFCLFVINDELFASGGYWNSTWIIKRNKDTSVWELLSEIDDGYRDYCSMAACGTKIYFFGGYYQSRSNNTWNSYDTVTNIWASEEGQYQDKAKRHMPLGIANGKAVCITPNEELLALSNWSGML